MKVFIVDYNGANKVSPYARMFQKNEWEICDNLWQADLIQFTGGEDVTPALYGQTKMNKTHTNPKRDAYELLCFMAGSSLYTPMAGICRGGQFLNVMCGGSMYQDVDGHIGSHEVVDHFIGKEDIKYVVTSTHHQMMIPGPNAMICATAARTTRRSTTDAAGVTSISHIKIDHSKFLPKDKDMEIIMYPDKKVLCFQPHPEFPNQEALANIYFDYVNLLMEV